MRAKQRGFTLMELMITLALAAVIMTIAVPNMAEFSRNNRLATAANDLLRSVYLARSEAIKRQSNVVICGAADPIDVPTTACEDEFRGWIVFDDVNGDWVRDADEPLIETHPALDSRITIGSDADGIVSFSRTGFANPANDEFAPTGFIVICDERGNVALGDNSRARALIIEGTGRARISSLHEQVEQAVLQTGTCAAPSEED